MESRLTRQGHFEAYHRGDTRGFHPGTFFRAEIPAMPVVAGRLLSLRLQFAHLLEAILRAVAPVCFALGNQALRRRMVEIKTLRLIVRSIWAAHSRPLVYVHPQPLKTLQDHFDRPFDLARHVSVLDAQDESTHVAPGEKPGEKGRMEIAHMHVSGGAGGKPGSDSISHSGI